MPSLNAQEDASGDSTHATGIIRGPRRRELVFSLFVSLWASAIAAVLVLAVYLTRTTYLQHVPLFSSTSIGGRFTQIQAKAIDFGFGAVVAPILIASANFLWFRVSRMTSFNERCHGPKSAPLRAVIEMASTNTGSYSIPKHFTLVKTSRPRFVLFSVLVLLSALSSTLLANVIAYEAYLGPAAQRSVVMQSLSFNGNLQRTNYEPDLYLMNLLNTLTYKNATSLLNKDNSYIGTNLTDVSIANLSSSVTGLMDVGAYRVTTTCQPAKINHFNFSIESWSGRFLSPNITVGSDSKHPIFHIFERISFANAFCSFLDFLADIPGNLADVASYDPATFYDIVAFNRQWDPSWVVLTPKVLLVTATHRNNPRKDSTRSSPSSFGDLLHYTFDVDFGDPAKAKITMEAWGIVCEINWQSGTMDMTRNRSTGIWSHSRLSFDDPTVNPFSWLSLSELLFSYHSPLPDTFSGMGGAIAASATTESKPCRTCGPGIPEPGSKRTLNFTTFALNYLYTAASLDNFIFNLDLCNGCIGKRDHDITVQAAFEDLVYRITYIPGILVFALLAIAATASIPLGMMLCSRDSFVLRTGRVLDPLRMAFDCAEALKGVDSLCAVSHWTRRKLERVGDRLIVGYHMALGEDEPRVKLSLEGDGTVRDSRVWEGTGDEASQHLLESFDEPEL